VSRALGPGRLSKARRGNGPERWILDWTGSDGVRRRQALSTDKAIAERMQREILRQRDLESVGLGTVEGQSRSIDEVRELFLQDLAVRATHQHVRNVRSHLQHFFEDVPVSRVRDLRPAHVIAHRARQIGAGSSRETQNHRLRALKAMFSWAAANSLIAQSPVAGVKRLLVGAKHVTRQRRALSDWEIERLLHAAEEDDREMQARLSATKSGRSKGTRWSKRARAERIPQAVFFRALVMTGARYGELVRATWHDVNVHEHTLALRGETTKSGRTRVLPLREALVRDLVALRETHERVLGSPGPRVFISPEGVEWPEVSRNALRVLHRVMKRAGIARRDEHGHVVDLHALRHTYASQLARRGVGLAITQQLLGHSDPSLTARHYTHLGIEDLREAVDRATNSTPAHVARAVGNPRRR